MKQRINIYIILTTIVVLWMSLSSFRDKPKCQGKTLSGTQCSRNAREGESFCFQHSDKSFRCGQPTKSGGKCKRVVKTSGQHCSQHK